MYGKPSAEGHEQSGFEPAGSAARGWGTLLVLGARRTQIPAIHEAQEMGMRVVAIDPDPSSPGFVLADATHVLDLADEARCIEVARNEKVDGVVTVGADYPIPVLASICAALGLPGLSRETARRATNKRLMREAFETAGVPSPRSIPCASFEQTLAATRRLRLPVILKPALSSGGRGITRVGPHFTIRELEGAFRRAMAETRADGVLVEEFVDGPEFSVEALTSHAGTRVVAVTDKLTSGAPYFVEVGHSQPSQYDPSIVASLCEVAVRAVGALDVEAAATHTEIRWTNDGPSVMEVGARLGGGYIASHLVPLSTGVNIVRAAIEIALAGEPNVAPIATSGVAIRFLHVAPGKVAEIGAPDGAKDVPGCIEAEIYVRRGGTVVPLVDAGGRIGHVICTGESAALAIERAEQALRRLCVITTTNL